MIVKICGWCPDVQEQMVSARAHGFDVTHAICPACERKHEQYAATALQAARHAAAEFRANQQQAKKE